MVSTALVGDEILLDLDHESRGTKFKIVALSPFAGSPRESLHVYEASLLKNVPRTSANLEAIVALRPDVIVSASFHKQDFLEQLKRFSKKNIILSQFESITDIKSMYLQVGEALDVTQETQALIFEFEKSIKNLKQTRKQIAVLTWTPDWVMMGKNTLWDDVITLSGGENLAKSFGLVGWGKINPETLIGVTPSFVVLKNDPNCEKIFHDATSHRFAKVPLIKLEPAYFSSLSLRVVEAIKILNERFAM